jgi:hypothetical protein
VAPWGRPAVNVPDDEPDSKLHRDRMTITVIAHSTKASAAYGVKLTFCCAAYNQIGRRREKGLPVTSLMRQPVTKLREATRTAKGDRQHLPELCERSAGRGRFP